MIAERKQNLENIKHSQNKNKIMEDSATSLKEAPQELTLVT